MSDPVRTAEEMRKAAARILENGLAIHRCGPVHDALQYGIREIYSIPVAEGERWASYDEAAEAVRGAWDRGREFERDSMEIAFDVARAVLSKAPPKVD